MKRLVVLLLLTFVCKVIFADYITISRSANIYSNSNRYSSVVDRVSKGDHLILLQDEWENGYYFIRNPESGVTGWVYKTMGRRHSGSIPGFAIEGTDGDLIVDIVDVGAGLCNIITLPDSRYIIYDAGHYRGRGRTTYYQIAEIVPPGSQIELLIMSHTDGDHIGAAGQILTNYRVQNLLHTGYEKSMISSSTPTASYIRLTDALDNLDYPINETNLHREDSTIIPGTQMQFGSTIVTFLCGFGTPPQEWGLTERSKKLNAVSIVMTIEYQDVSILFGGDAVGKLDDEQPVATEHFLLSNAQEYLDVDILIAPHHGADNGSSNAFIEATSPQYVIFSAGHDHEHPRRTTAERFINNDVNINNIYRTDRGDDEDDPREWDNMRIIGCVDSYGDDDVRIVISETGVYSVFYLLPEDPGCE